MFDAIQAVQVGFFSAGRKKKHQRWQWPPSEQLALICAFHIIRMKQLTNLSVLTTSGVLYRAPF